jgi:hypothetical protein
MNATRTKLLIRTPSGTNLNSVSGRKLREDTRAWRWERTTRCAQAVVDVLDVSVDQDEEIDSLHLVLLADLRDLLATWRTIYQPKFIDDVGVPSISSAVRAQRELVKRLMSLRVVARLDLVAVVAESLHGCSAAVAVVVRVGIQEIVLVNLVLEPVCDRILRPIFLELLMLFQHFLNYADFLAGPAVAIELAASRVHGLVLHVVEVSSVCRLPCNDLRTHKTWAF